MHKYSYTVIWSDEDDAYICTVPEFPGLSAFGDTPDEAIEEAKVALEGFIEIYKQDGCKLPEPRKLQNYSGEFRIRMPKSLHGKLSKDAQEEGVSLNTHIVTLLSENRISERLLKKISGSTPITIQCNFNLPNHPVIQNENEFVYHMRPSKPEMKIKFGNC